MIIIIITIIIIIIIVSFLTGEASATARTISPREKASTILFSMALENVELMHDCFPKQLRMATARMK